MMKRSVMHLVAAVSITFGGAAGARASPRPFCGGSAAQWSVAMATSQMARFDDPMTFGYPGAPLGYQNGLFSLSLLFLGGYVGDDAITAYGEHIITSRVDDAGNLIPLKNQEIELVNMPAGRTLLAAFKRAGDPRYQAAAKALRARIDGLPRTANGLFVWRPNQMLLDSFWMILPFYGEYASVFNEPAAFDDIVHQFRTLADVDRDPETRLLYHGWDEFTDAFWADRTTGRSASVWGRALGWYAMALVDALDTLPASHPGRPYLVALLNELAPALVRFQDPRSGLWFEVVDQGERAGNYTETSASAMFIYTLAKAINRGYVDRKFAPPALRAYSALIGYKTFYDDHGRLSLTGTVQSAGLGTPGTKPATTVTGTLTMTGPLRSRADTIPGMRDGSYDYYIHQPIVTNNLQGIGPFILAGVEIDKLVVSLSRQQIAYAVPPKPANCRFRSVPSH